MCRSYRRNRRGIQSIVLAGLLVFLYSFCHAQEREARECVMEALVTEACARGLDMAEDLPEPSAVLTCIPEEVVVQEGAFSYGNLEFALDSGVTVQVDEISEDETVIELPGASCEDWDAFLPPRITLSHYHAEYINEKTLICAILEEIPKAKVLKRYFGNGNKRMYSYHFTDGCFDYYVLVYGEDLYLLGEIVMEADYSVNHLLEESAVTWKDCGWKIYEWEEPNGIYSRVDEGGIQFLVENCPGFYEETDPDLTHFYRRGCYEEAYQTFCARFYEDSFMDLNFDGYPDLKMRDSDDVVYYLWDAKKQTYLQAHLNIGEYDFYDWDIEMYPETQTILLWDTFYDEDWNESEYAESICKWEGTELNILRECRRKIEGNSVRVYAYEGDGSHALFDETFDRELWEEDESVVRPLYEKFYDGLLPKEDAWERNYSVEAETAEPHIPQEFLDILADTLENGNALEVMKPMVNDREVEWEELVGLAQKNLQIRLELEPLYGGLPGYLALEADLDNDGTKDLFLEIADGGSGGGTEAAFFKGKEDGTYERTCRNTHVREEVAILGYEGKNYLCRTTYDYGLKQVNGLELFCYEDGVRVEEVWLRMVPASCDILVAECPDGAYRELAAAVAAEGETFREQISEYEIIVGDTERERKTEDGREYLCDLDNDGIEECYAKYIWTCSNYYTCDGLTFFGEETEAIENAIYNGNGEPMMMWVESANGKNIVNVLYVTGLWDYEIAGYLFEGDDHRVVYRIDGNAQYEVEQTRTGVSRTDNSDPYVGI